MSTRMMQFLERLAEMFPSQNYQSRLEQYIVRRKPTSHADVEHWEREYWYHNTQGSQL